MRPALSHVDDLATVGSCLLLRDGGVGIQDLLRGGLGSGDDHGRRVAGHHAGEDRPVDDEEVVGAVDLGVEIDDGGTPVETAVLSQFGGTFSHTHTQKVSIK